MTSDEGLNMQNNSNSFNQSGDFLGSSRFVKDDVVISSSGGLTIRGEDLMNTFDPDQLELGDMIGKGACSTVRKALHKPSN